MSECFPEPFRIFGGNIKVKVDLSDYATKTDLKNVTHVDTSSFALKIDLANLKTEVDKLDTEKLKTVPVDLSKLSNVVKNEVVKKTVYDKLVTKVNNIDTGGFLLKTKYDADKLELKKKIPDTSNLVKKSDYNTKISEIEGKIPSISNLATPSALTAVQNKIPSTSNLVKKTDYKSKISEIKKKLTDHNHDKYIATAEFNKLTAENFSARFSQANLITKIDFDAKLSSLNRKITSNKTKHLIIENELKKVKTFDLGYFTEKSHFDEDGAQNYLVFQPILKLFYAECNWITKWKSKGLSNENVEVVSTSDNTLTPSINYYENKARLRFTGSVLQQ